MSASIIHPLSVGVSITGKKPTCACRGATMVPVSGKILKVIKNHTGTWYYLDAGTTIRDTWVEQVISQ